MCVLVCACCSLTVEQHPTQTDPPMYPFQAPIDTPFSPMDHPCPSAHITRRKQVRAVGQAQEGRTGQGEGGSVEMEQLGKGFVQSSGL